MNCPIETLENAEVLLAYCARTLDPETTLILERHLAVCPMCKEFQHKQQAVWEALDAWEAMPVSPDFNRRLYQRIEAEAQTSWWTRITRPLRPAFGPGLLSRGVPLAATLCLLVLAGVILQRPDDVVAPEGLASDARMESIQPEQVERTLDEMELLRQFRATTDAGTVNSM